MYKFIVLALIFVSVIGKAQEPITFLKADSITYQSFLAGDWEQVIVIGKQAISQDIDFKRLRQRMGYAYFAKGNYFASQKQYEKALTFDEYDTDTRTYLYYCGLNTGKEAYARYHADKLPLEIQKSLHIKAFKIIDAIDLEYNYKANTSATRSNPTYERFGVNTQLDYRWSLYQSVSNYRQTVDGNKTKQPEYFARLSWYVTSHTTFNLGYHYLNTIINSDKFVGNMIYAGVNKNINRFNFGLSGSYTKDDIGDFKQVGILAGYTLPGRSNIYIKSSVIRMIEKRNNRNVFSQTAGARITKSLWAEGNVTLGDIKNYTDNNGLYVYNSLDPTVFRTGLTLFWNLGKRATLIGNYTYDTKQIKSTANQYMQHSFSGGIIWKF